MLYLVRSKISGLGQMSTARVLDGNVNKAAHTPAVEPPDAEPSEARPNTSDMAQRFGLLERSNQRRDGKRGLVLPGWIRCPIRPEADGPGGSASSVKPLIR